MVGCNEEHAAVLTPGHVAGLHSGLEPPQPGAVRGEHVHASGSGGEHVAGAIELEPVGRTLVRLHLGAGFRELPARPQATVGFDGLGHPDGGERGRRCSRTDLVSHEFVAGV